MKKILFLINTLSGGGAEKVLVDLVNNMDKSKYSITLLTRDLTGIYFKDVASDICVKSINKFKNPLLKKLFNKLLTSVLKPEWVYNLFVKGDYDIEVAFLEGEPTKILSASPNKNKIAWVHTDLYNYYGHEKIFKTIEENGECYRKFNKIICVSESAKVGFKKQFGFDENVYVQYNPVNEKNIIEKAREAIDEIKISSKLKVVTVGRLVQQKGYDRLLSVHRRLIDEEFDYELWIIGDGSDRKSLEKYIMENNLTNSVKLLGFQANPYKFMSAADVFVCSSYVEGFSTVMTEAIILGLPCVTTNCSGMTELIGNSEYGRLIENDEDGIYNGIKSLLTDKKMREKYKDKAKIRRKSFKLSNRISEIEKIFDEI